MTSLSEMDLTFSFPDSWRATKYDGWPYYQNRFKDRCLGSKAVDFLAIAPYRKTLWLIEVKDYRSHRRAKDISMWDEMALKVKDTLAGLVASKMDATHDQHQFAADCLDATRIRVVLHLEQPAQDSKLFPRPYNVANVEDKLRQLLKPIDAHPVVAEMAVPQNLAWRVSPRGAVDAN